MVKANYTLPPPSNNLSVMAGGSINAFGYPFVVNDDIFFVRTDDNSNNYYRLYIGSIACTLTDIDKINNINSHLNINLNRPVLACGNVGMQTYAWEKGTSW
jgi:hypothetical protein